MQEFDKIGEDLFNKIRGRFPEVTIGDETGTVTNKPGMARFFDFNYNGLGKVSVAIDKDEGLTIIYSKDFMKDQNETTQRAWYDFLKELRVFSKKRMLNYSVRDITKSNLTKRDYKFLAKPLEDGQMTTESKLYGTSKISYQKVGEARIVIKHTESINAEVAAGRTRSIGKIYIESADGERFIYPFKHLSGARAMARHVAEGGKPFDDFGTHIVGLSEEMSKLRKFSNYMGRSSVMAESLVGYVDIVKERIKTVKKTIEGLQKPAYYAETFAAFEKPMMEDVPNDVAENWIDQLTIKQFNEELQDVFPYIYKLVSEATKAKELGPDDLVDESGLQYYTGVKKHGKEYMKKAAEAGRNGANQEELGRLKDKYSKAAKTKEEIEIDEAFESMMGQFSEHVCEDCGNLSWRTLAVEEIEQIEEAEKKGLYYYVNKRKKAGTSRSKDDPKSPSPQDWKNAAKTAKESVEEETNEEKKKGSHGKVCWKGYRRGKGNSCHKVSEEHNNVDEAAEDRTSYQVAKILVDRGITYDPAQEDELINAIGMILVKELMMTPKQAKYLISYDEDFVSDTMGELRSMEQSMPEAAKKGLYYNVNKRKKAGTSRDASSPKAPTAQAWKDAAKTAKEGNAYANAVRQAKMNGKKKGDKVAGPDGDEITLEKQQTPLGEFILSYFDRETGVFPKGETAVLTMVEKDYGEQFIEPAKAFIEQINVKFEEFQMRTQPQQMEAPMETTKTHGFKKGDLVRFKGKAEEFEIYSLAGEGDDPNTVYIRKPGTTPTQGAVASTLEPAQSKAAPKFKQGDTVEFKGTVYKVYSVDKDDPNTLYLQEPGQTRTMGVWAGGGDVKLTQAETSTGITRMRELAGLR